MQKPFSMMAHKQHLHQLLKQDQEPFHLQTYISERRYKHVCLSPYHQESQNTAVLLPLPALLLEAAMRIEKKQGSHENRAKMKNFGFGILGSALKKLKDLKKNSRSYQNGEMEDKSFDETRFFCNCYNHNSSISTTLSPFSGHRSPELSSLASSPVFLNKENQKSAEGSSNEVGGETSEQCSPVSILDPPFEDDHVVRHEDRNEDEFEDDSCDEDDDDLGCSFAIVQDAKEKLLDKLRRFEKLAELDPVELGKRMIEEEEENDDKHGLKNKEVMIRRVSRRLSYGKEVERKEIDLMVKLDFEREFDGRKMNPEETEKHREIVNEIEVALFRLLMEEVTEELTSL